MTKLVNRVKVTTSTVGTGTLTLGAAVDGYQSFADAISDGDVVRYVIEDGVGWEIGRGAYTAAANTLSRGPVESSAAGATISLSGAATVFVGATAGDIYGYSAAILTSDLTLTSNVEYEVGAQTTVASGATLIVPHDAALTVNSFTEKRSL